MFHGLRSIIINKKFLITGGAGFIGSAVIRQLIKHTQHSVVNVDKLTYAGNLQTLDKIKNDSRYNFEQADICNNVRIREIFEKHKPDIIMHLAAETHVDRSISGPDEFIQTNIIGTYVLLQEARRYWNNLSNHKKTIFRFHNVSTDEVFGDLAQTDNLFTEETPYAPSSPYSATKASADHLVRAWERTYQLPTLITNCSNNYGPYQFPEKLIPVVILNAIEGKKIPIYGNGEQIRDWLYVDDHARALVHVALKGNIGETYNIGGHNEIKNIEAVKTICNILDELVPSQFDGISQYQQLISFVDDRKGHDIRYAIDASKIASELNWRPDETFASGMKKTVKWYLDNINWCNGLKKVCYKKNNKNV